MNETWSLCQGSIRIVKLDVNINSYIMYVYILGTQTREFLLSMIGAYQKNVVYKTLINSYDFHVIPYSLEFSLNEEI